MHFYARMSGRCVMEGKVKSETKCWSLQNCHMSNLAWKRVLTPRFVFCSCVFSFGIRNAPVARLLPKRSIKNLGDCSSWRRACVLLHSSHRLLIQLHCFLWRCKHHIFPIGQTRAPEEESERKRESIFSIVFGNSRMYTRSLCGSDEVLVTGVCVTHFDASCTLIWLLRGERLAPFNSTENTQKIVRNNNSNSDEVNQHPMLM